ncbi:MAG TPA: DNA polymerase IV [Dongiaceae bacterium]|nr:DNA polymerase IV [Dongiaceae bacterium]
MQPAGGTAEPGFCRDCGREVGAAERRCPDCRSTRLLRHPELAGLSIAHIDCDAFYAAIEKRDDPRLRDKPLIIGGGHRGVVSTACYIARMSGVRSAMPMFKARKLCPEAVVLPPNMAKYREAGAQVRALMLDYTPLVEPLSIDEAFLDLSGTEKLHRMTPARSLNRLSQEIERKVGITVSIGLSHNKFLAKIASDLDKPRGFAVIGRAETMEFLASKPVSLIWGVGKVMRERLEKDGIATIAALQQMTERDLAGRYGRMGAHLFHLARGEDHRAVDPEGEAKSISAETTFDIDIADPEALLTELWPLCEKVSARLKHAELSGHVVHLKLKTAGFKLVSRQIRLPHATQLAETLYRTGEILLRREAKGPPGGEKFRLIGIGADDLHGAEDADPIDLADPGADQRRKVERAMDAVRKKLGGKAIVKGRSLRG